MLKQASLVLYGWNGLLSSIRNWRLKAANALSIETRREECVRLNNSLALAGLFLLLYSVKWYRTPLYGGKKPGRHA
jgi:hypothetical protein